MKAKNLLFFAVFSICVFSIKTSAQSTTVVGNGQYVSWEEVIPGNPNAEHMRIQSGGNVGIGTTTPLQTLDVNGTMRLATPTGTPVNILGHNTTSGEVGVITIGTGLTLNGTSLEATGGGPAWLLAGNAGTTPGTDFIGTTDNNSLIFKTFGQPVVYVTADASPGLANVGINEPVPAFKLHVSGDFMSTFTSGGWANTVANTAAISGVIKQNGTSMSVVGITTGEANLAWTDGAIGGGFTADAVSTRVTRVETNGGPINQLWMNPSGFWFAQRYGAVTFEGYPGMTSSTEWRDETGNLKAVVTNAGEVCIGTGTTVTPAQTLEVRGTARITTPVNVAANRLMGWDSNGDITEVLVDPACFCLVYDSDNETNILTCGSGCNPLRKPNPNINNTDPGQKTGLSQIITDKDGEAVQIKDGANLVYLNYTRIQDNATFTMPANPFDGQTITFASADNTIDAAGNKVEQGFGINKLTLLPSAGQTLDWSNTILCCGVHFTFRYFSDISRWLLISNK